tara:strand:+ start:5223 stop:6575 length:1353 start_codon:yes stop_codon:yes gene_type:complete
MQLSLSLKSQFLTHKNFIEVMSHDHKRVQKIIDRIESQISPEEFVEQIAPRSAEEVKELEDYAYPMGYSKENQNQRIDFLNQNNIRINHLSNPTEIDQVESLKGNIENFIGMAQIPVGLAGPILINGTNAVGDFFVPLATSEGALVASYNRGMKACRLSGGISAMCTAESVQRSPFFKFDSMGIMGLFVKWVHEHLDNFKNVVSESSNYAQLNEMRTNVEGNSVILTFDYFTGDASGQNMVTICTDNVCKYILDNFPHKPIEWYIESNYSGDKKATSLSFSSSRGKKVTSEIVLLKDVVNHVLKTTPKAIADYWQSSTLGVVQSGAIGAQGHVANGLAALFIACGQDVACVSESSVGITRMEVTAQGDLYVALTLPSLIVGTIGGGTKLPTQNECLKMMDCAGVGKAKKFAEICCAVALSGEISIAAAMSAGHFTRAHESLGRNKGDAGK